jgi:hypothetical protein
MTGLAAWLLEQIAEDEAVCRDQGETHTLGCAATISTAWEHECRCGFAGRVLAECEAKRRIIAMHGPTTGFDGVLTYPAAAKLCRTCGPGDNWQAEQEPFGELPCDHLRLMALPYADRPGYREEWRP